MLRLHHGLLRLLLLRLLLLHGHDVGLLRPALLLHREVTRTWWRSGSRKKSYIIARSTSFFGDPTRTIDPFQSSRG